MSGAVNVLNLVSTGISGCVNEWNLAQGAGAKHHLSCGVGTRVGALHPGWGERLPMSGIPL